jgi:hypothetical protein
MLFQGLFSGENLTWSIFVVIAVYISCVPVSATDDFVTIDDDASWQWACDGSVCDSQGGPVKPNGCCATNCCYGSNKCCNGNGECEMCGYTAAVAIASSSVGAILFCIFCIGGIVGGIVCCWWQRKRLQEQRAAAAAVATVPVPYGQLQTGVQMQATQPGRAAAYYGHPPGTVPGQYGGHYGVTASHYGNAPVQYGGAPIQYGGVPVQYGGVPAQHGGGATPYVGASVQYAGGSAESQCATATAEAVPSVPFAEVVQG